MNGMDGGTALKPSYEPIILARKKFKGSCVDNVIKWGVGGLNIDECRVGSNKEDINKLNKEWDREWNTSYKSYAENVGGSAGFDYSKARVENKGLTGRFPANTILTYDETDFDEVCGGFPINKSSLGPAYYKGNYTKNGWKNTSKQNTSKVIYNDSGSASRYFYCAKASKRDRDEGLDDFEEQAVRVINATNPELEEKDDVSKRFITVKRNIHPTVKPTELMQYLIRLVTPNNGTILDPFMRKWKYRESSNV